MGFMFIFLSISAIGGLLAIPFALGIVFEDERSMRRTTKPITTTVADEGMTEYEKKQEFERMKREARFISYQEMHRQERLARERLAQKEQRNS